MEPLLISGPPKPSILQGICDQHGQHWIRYGTSDRNILLSIADLQRDPSAVFTRLVDVGKRALTNKAKDAFRQEIEAFDRYENLMVISCTGWTDGLFRYADGGTFSNRFTRTSAVVATVEADTKAGWSGDLATWLTAIAPFVEDQPLVLFILAYSFVGPLLAFSPVDIQNPIIELVGPRQMGKSTLGILAGSVWGGHPGSSCGFGVTWDLTAGAIDEVMEKHRDQLLYLEETNLAGENDAERAKLVGKALFKMTSSQPRLRFGEAGPVVHVRTAVLSTGNTPLRQLIGTKSEADRAALSRVLTLFASRRFGIFETVPPSYPTAGAAVQALHRIAAVSYGSAGRCLVQALADRYVEGRLPSDVAECYERYLRHPIVRKFGEGRLAKILAITCAAHEIASHFGILPDKWNSILDAIASLEFGVVEEPQVTLPEVDRLRGYVRDQASLILNAEALTRPLTPEQFESAAGVWCANGCLLVATGAFKRAFPDHRALLQQLRTAGILLAEGGQWPKSSRKVPARICADHGRRAYFFKL